MEKLLLLGGTYDPVHNGHILLLKEAIKKIAPTRVVIMPTGIPPHKQKNNTSSNLKLKMCECFLSLHENIIIDDAEIKRGGKSYTSDTIKYLKTKYSNAQIFISIGSDMLLIFRQWNNYKFILQNATIVVHCREFEDSEKLENYADSLIEEGANIIIVNADIVEISSTQIREMVKNGQSISNLVPPLVESIIKEHNLYNK